MLHSVHMKINICQSDCSGGSSHRQKSGSNSETAQHFAIIMRILYVKLETLIFKT